jgi:hypothetical protein
MVDADDLLAQGRCWLAQPIEAKFDSETGSSGWQLLRLRHRLGEQIAPQRITPRTIQTEIWPFYQTYLAVSHR